MVGARLLRFVRRIARDARGSSVVEFALAAPVLGLVVVGIADYGRGFSQRFALETAAHRTLERAAVGTTNTDYSFLAAEAAAAAGVPAADVTFDNWLECQNDNGTTERMPNYNDACDDEQQVARYIQVTIYKNFSPSFKWTGKGSTYRLSGAAAARVQ
jgi:Flp pilus assembly protein TadG